MKGQECKDDDIKTRAFMRHGSCVFLLDKRVNFYWIKFSEGWDLSHFVKRKGRSDFWKESCEREDDW